MKRSTFCEIKYILTVVFFFKGGVYDWGWFQILTHTLEQTLPPPLHPLPLSDYVNYLPLYVLLQVVLIMLNR